MRRVFEMREEMLFTRARNQFPTRGALFGMGSRKQSDGFHRGKRSTKRDQEEEFLGNRMMTGHFLKVKKILRLFH